MSFYCMVNTHFYLKYFHSWNAEDVSISCERGNCTRKETCRNHGAKSPFIQFRSSPRFKGSHSINNLSCLANGLSLKLSDLLNPYSRNKKCYCFEILQHLEYTKGFNKPKRLPSRNHLPTHSAFLSVNLKSKSPFIDSHCHLDFLFQRQKFSGTYAEYQNKHKNTYPPNYQGCVAVFCKPSTFSKKSEWNQYLEEENVWGAFGCHPHNAEDYDDSVEEALICALSHPQVRALGEIGLDYSDRNRCRKEVQHQVFKRQLKIAYASQLSLIIHCREADEDCIKILQEFLPEDYAFHLHCFTENWNWAQKWMEAFPRVYIGITNLVTYSSAKPTHEVVKKIPLNHLLLETDAPYFLPRKISKRIRWSHPGMAIYVAAQIAALRNITLEEVLDWTYKNTRKMYKI